MIERFHSHTLREKNSNVGKNNLHTGKADTSTGQGHRSSFVIISFAPRRARSAKNTLIRAAASAAACKLTINDNSRDTADAVLFRLGGRLGLMHVMDHNLVRRSGYSFDEFDGFLAGRTARAEDFDFLSCLLGPAARES